MSPRFVDYLYIIARFDVFGKGLLVVFAQSAGALPGAGKGTEKFFKCPAEAEEGGIQGGHGQGRPTKKHPIVQKVCKFFT